MTGKRPCAWNDVSIWDSESVDVTLGLFPMSQEEVTPGPTEQEHQALGAPASIRPRVTWRPGSCPCPVSSSGLRPGSRLPQHRAGSLSVRMEWQTQTQAQLTAERKRAGPQPDPLCLRPRLSVNGRPGGRQGPGTKPWLLRASHTLLPCPL